MRTPKIVCTRILEHPTRQPLEKSERSLRTAECVTVANSYKLMRHFEFSVKYVWHIYMRRLSAEVTTKNPVKAHCALHLTYHKVPVVIDIHYGGR